MALCYLKAIRAKVPELVEKEKMGDRIQGEPDAKVPELVKRKKMEDAVQGELDLSGKIVQGDLEAEEWRVLSLDSVMADFIYMDATADTDSAKPEAMATESCRQRQRATRCLVIHVSTCNIKPRFFLKWPEIPFGAKSHQET